MNYIKQHNMIDYLLGLLNVFLTGANLNQAKKQEKSEVISTIRNALRATKKHIQENRSNEFGDEDFSDVDSKELSDMWSKAAQAIRPSDPGLAAIFEEKSDYWTNPTGFRREIQEGQRRFNFRF
jgi:hypothetical protein